MAILAQIEAGDSIAQVARQNGLHPSMVNRWKGEYNKDPEKIDKLTFWIEAPDGWKYKSKANINSGSGEFEVLYDGTWTIVIQNDNLTEEITISYNVEIIKNNNSSLCCTAVILISCISLVSLGIYIRRKMIKK